MRMHSVIWFEQVSGLISAVAASDLAVHRLMESVDAQHTHTPFRPVCKYIRASTNTLGILRRL